jgi:ferrous iron transport protein B
MIDRAAPRTEGNGERALGALSEDLSVPVVPVDARSLDRAVADGGEPAAGGPDGIGAEATHVFEAIEAAGRLPGRAGTRTGRHVEPPESILERTYLGPVASGLALLLPAVVAVWFALSVADRVEPAVEAALSPAIAWASTLPEPLSTVLAADYGLLAMGPFLFVWAGPTMIVFAVFIGAYKASGLITRITAALHPAMVRVGLTGHDLVRVVMGFGCNVPAVTNTRSCSSCTRCTTISAISFGSACSYQFPATLAVFAAVGMPWLVGPYLAVLVVTTLIYVRLIASPGARGSSMAVDGRNFLEWPRPNAIWREARGSLRSFVSTALPVFVGICVVAALADWLGAIERLGSALGPAMAPFDLPAEAALVVVLASVRKDGIALLTADAAGVTALSPVQVLVAVYLAGVLLPCLVTAFTIAREISPRYVAAMMTRQAAAAVGFSLLLAWGGRLLF